MTSAGISKTPCLYHLLTKPDALDPGCIVALLQAANDHESGLYRGIFMNHIDHETWGAIHRFLALIASRYDMAEAIVFGSRARGTHRPDSDADVAVLLRGEHRPFLAVKLDMADTAFDVLIETGILISPLPIWLDEWEHPENYSNPALLRNINREGVRV